MRFLLSTYGGPDAWDLGATGDGPTWSRADIEAMVEYMRSEDTRLYDSGELVLDAGLAPPAASTTVRTDGDQVHTTDGPHQDAAEVLAGFWVIDCADHDRAVAIAARFSRVPGPGGTVQDVPIEIRPIGAAPTFD